MCFKIISGFAVTSLQGSRKPRQGWGVCGSCAVPALGVESGCAVGMGQERGCGSGAVGAGLELWGFGSREGASPQGKQPSLVSKNNQGHWIQLQQANASAMTQT